MLWDHLGRVVSEGSMPDDDVAESSMDLPWRWLFLAALAFLRGATIENGAGFEPAELWFLLGAAALAAFFVDWLRRLGRNRQRSCQSVIDPVALINILRDYGVEELGGFYFYMPSPSRPEDEEARAWLRILKAKQVVVSGPWRLEASRAPPWLRRSHPRICSDDVLFYEVYRLRRDPLAAFV